MRFCMPYARDARGCFSVHASLIVEKPFGRDLASARDLNRVARAVFPEDSIFRIDHFLAKEAIMNILYFRFAIVRPRRLDRLALLAPI